MLKKIDHINIVVNSLKESKEFFCRLGFTVQHEGDLEGEWISSIVNLNDVKASYVQLSLPNTETNLELIKFYSPTPPDGDNKNLPNHIGIRHIAFEVDDIEKIVASMVDDEVEFFGDVQTYPETGKKLVYFYGPDGIILEFAQYKESGSEK